MIDEQENNGTVVLPRDSDYIIINSDFIGYIKY